MLSLEASVEGDLGLHHIIWSDTKSLWKSKTEGQRHSETQGHLLWDWQWPSTLKEPESIWKEKNILAKGIIWAQLEEYEFCVLMRWKEISVPRASQSTTNKMIEQDTKPGLEYQWFMDWVTRRDVAGRWGRRVFKTCIPQKNTTLMAQRKSCFQTGQWNVWVPDVKRLCFLTGQSSAWKGQYDDRCVLSAVSLD